MTQRHRPADKLCANSRPPAHNRNEVRAAIAHSAARLIAEGLADYRTAKQKAARQYGVADNRMLPDNHEIESALRAHLALFASETQPRVLAALREIAVSAMLRLEQFSPWLVGSVLNGTATEFSDIELELIGVEPKDFEMYLLNAGIKLTLCDERRFSAHAASPAHASRAARFRLEFDGAAVTVTLYAHHTARMAAHPRESLGHDRAQRADARRRFMSAKS